MNQQYLLDQLNQLNLLELEILQYIDNASSPITVNELQNITSYQKPANNSLLCRFCALKDDEIEFPFLIRVPKGKNGKYLYSLNPYITTDLIQQALYQKFQPRKPQTQKQQSSESLDLNQIHQQILDQLEQIHHQLKKSN
jgi:hypothetical protein